MSEIIEEKAAEKAVPASKEKPKKEAKKRKTEKTSEEKKDKNFTDPEAKNTSGSEKPQPTAPKKEMDFLAPYRKAYPGVKTFHVTTDKQVFLDKDEHLAKLHQRSIGADGKIQTIKVK